MNICVPFLGPGPLLNPGVTVVNKAVSVSTHMDLNLPQRKTGLEHTYSYIITIVLRQQGRIARWSVCSNQIPGPSEGGTINPTSEGSEGISLVKGRGSGPGIGTTNCHHVLSNRVLDIVFDLIGWLENHQYFSRCAYFVLLEGGILNCGSLWCSPTQWIKSQLCDTASYWLYPSFADEATVQPGEDVRLFETGRRLAGDAILCQL